MVTANKSKNIIDCLHLTDAELIKLQQAAVNTDPQELWSAVQAALQNFVTKTETLAPKQAAEQKFNFLQTLAAVSPNCRARMPAALDQQQTATIDKIVTELINPNVLQDVHSDLVNAMQANIQQMQQDQAAYVQMLKDKQRNNTHVQAALDEYDHITDKAIISKRDNAMFDTRVIGHLLAILLILGFIVPLDAENYPAGFKFNAPDKDEHREFYRRMHANTEVLPGEAVEQPGILPYGSSLRKPLMI